MTKQKSKRPPSSLLGLKLERTKIEGVVVRRAGAGVQIQKSFQSPLTLDPLTNDPELVGREILNQLNAAGVRERRCAVCLPLYWALTLQIAIPGLPEEDIADFLSLEAEKGFPYPLDELLMGTSRFRSPAGDQFATLVAIPKSHLTLLEKALRAAKLKPVSFSLSITSVQAADPQSSADGGLISLWVGENIVELQITSGEGVVALRSIQGNAEPEAGQRSIDADTLTRELKITLGQLPRSIGEGMRKLRLFGRPELTQGLLKEIRPRADLMGLEVEAGTTLRVNGYTLPAGKEGSMSPALGLAARCVLGHPPAFEFLPPKISRFPQLVARFSSRKIFPIAAVAALILLPAGGLMGYRMWQEAQLRLEWSQIEPRVAEIRKIQASVKTYQSWYNDFSFLEMYKQLVNAFPANGVELTAKSIQVKEPFMVTVTGSARNASSLNKLEGQLSDVKGIANVDLKRQAAQAGSASVQFTLTFQWLGTRAAN